MDANRNVGEDYTDGGLRQRVRTNGNYRTVDLHYMTVKESKDEVLNQLKLAKQDKCMCKLLKILYQQITYIRKK